MPEINQETSKLARKNIDVSFVPHLIPMNRGILETIYIELKGKKSEKEIFNIYRRFYKTEPFVRIKNQGEFPQTKDVLGTNYCDIGIKVVKNKKMLIVVAAIDNLMKGAASQAVQNMNIVCNFKESLSLQ